jgi:hypothetical protein
MSLTIPGLPEQFTDLPGVQMQPPPASLLESTTKFVMDAANTLQPHENGALVFVATTEGVNAAVVHRFDESFAVVGWVGKEWGKPLAAGVAGSLRW